MVKHQCLSIISKQAIKHLLLCIFLFCPVKPKKKKTKYVYDQVNLLFPPISSSIKQPKKKKNGKKTRTQNTQNKTLTAFPSACGLQSRIIKGLKLPDIINDVFVGAHPRLFWRKEKNTSCSLARSLNAYIKSPSRSSCNTIHPFPPKNTVNRSFFSSLLRRCM